MTASGRADRPGQGAPAATGLVLLGIPLLIVGLILNAILPIELPWA